MIQLNLEKEKQSIPKTILNADINIQSDIGNKFTILEI